MNIFSDIIIPSFFEAIAVTTLLYLFCFEKHVAKWEQKQWARFKRFIRRQLRKSKRIVAWAEGTDVKTFNSHLPEAGIWKDVWFKA